MKALPARFSEQTKTAACDPTITYTIRPLNNRVQSLIQTNSLEYSKDAEDKWQPKYDGGGAAYDTVGFGLVALTGLEGMKLDHIKVKIGKEQVQRITDECLDRLPSDLFQELWLEINASGKLLQDEAKNIKNTPDSSTPISTVENATETSEPASTTA